MIAGFREALVGVALALMLEVANRTLFFKDSGGMNAGSVLALTVAVVGLLLSVSRMSLQEHFRGQLQRVDKMADIVDITVDSDITSINALLRAYLRVSEPEFREVKDQVVLAAIEQLHQLAEDKRSATLGALDYYQWLFRAFDSVGKGGYIHAVSLSSDTEWNESELEKKFLDKNIERARDGVKVERMFVVEPSRLSDFLKLVPISKHCVEESNSLVGYYVSLDELKESDPNLLKAIGEGFIDFNGQVAIEDVFDHDGAARGQVTVHPTDLRRMLNIYERLAHMAVPLSRELAEAGSNGD